MKLSTKKKQIEKKYGFKIIRTNSFILSCIRFYSRYGYLSPKQIIHVKRQTTPRKIYYRNDGFYTDGWSREEDSDFASCFDWGSQ